MPRLIVMPMIGEIRQERLDSLRGCHALFERSALRRFSSAEEFDAALKSAVKELLLADRVKALSGDTQFIIRIEG